MKLLTVPYATSSFSLNCALSSAVYEIKLVYRTTTAGKVTEITGETLSADMVTLTADGLWHEAKFFTNPSSYFDYDYDGRVHLVFVITAVGTLVDAVYASLDSDRDGLTDTREISVCHTNPYSNDTDSDNLNDLQELSAGTNQRNPDSDGDGLMDGGERYSYVVSTDQFLKVPGAGNVQTTISLPTISGQIDAVYAQVGIVHDYAQGLRIEISRDGGSGTFVSASAPSGQKNIFSSWSLTGTFAISCFQTAANWRIKVIDSSGYSGTLQYFKLQVDGRTNPLVADTDSDGLNDSEEENQGVDGYVTCPVLGDTDQDGIGDKAEITGTGSPTGKISDPTLADTDNDGFADYVDLEPCGDRVVKVDFSSFKFYDTLWNGAYYGVNQCDVFFTIQVNGQYYSTDHFWATKDSWASCVSYGKAMTYYFDVWDSNTSVSVDISSFADNIDCGGDSWIDARNPSTGTGVWTYSMGAAKMQCVGNGHTWSCDGKDGTVKFNISTEVLSRSNTIIVNGTNDGDGYGLYQTPSGSYRYSADDQVYMIYLNCSSAYGTLFTQGLNVIVLPRSVALASGFNTTLQNLGSITSSSPFYNCNFYATDTTKATSSGHVIGVVSKNLTGTQANDFLNALLVNGNERVGNFIHVTTPSDFYLLHLPKDVLASIPNAGVVNGPMGPQPDCSAMVCIDILSIS